MAVDAYHGMNADFASRLRAMVAASGGRLKIVSGYRSVERQTQLWNAALKKYGSAAKARKWVAPPGKSNHNHGLAADLKGDLAWAHKNAARFGLHFPLSNENWHIELVGARGKKKDAPVAPAAVEHHRPGDGHDHGPQAVPAEPVENRNDLGVQLQSLARILEADVTETMAGVM